MKEKQPDPIKTFRAQWAVMTFYERFEQVIALALSAIIAVIIVVSLLQLISIVFSLLVIDAFNPLDHKVFQTVFGMIMTLLIAWSSSIPSCGWPCAAIVSSRSRR